VIRIALTVFVAAAICACSQQGTGGAEAVSGQTVPIANGDFERAASGDEVPGWTLAQHAGVAAYKAMLDRDGAAHGQTSLRFTRTVPQVYGEMMQRLNLARYGGKTIELSAMLKCADVGPKGWKLFINANVPDTLAYSPGVKETTGWQRQSVRLKLPPQIGDVMIGATLLDGGTGWFDDVQLRVVD
jgi:hypothetical protein